MLGWISIKTILSLMAFIYNTIQKILQSPAKLEILVFSRSLEFLLHLNNKSYYQDQFIAIEFAILGFSLWIWLVLLESKLSFWGKKYVNFLQLSWQHLNIVPEGQVYQFPINILNPNSFHFFLSQVEGDWAILKGYIYRNDYENFFCHLVLCDISGQFLMLLLQQPCT